MNQTLLARRSFLSQSGVSLATAALATLVAESSAAESTVAHFPGQAKRVIYLCQSGAPSQLDLFDYKPNLLRRYREELPDSVRRGQRLTTMTSNQKSFPIAPSRFKFSRYGHTGTWLSELLPFTSQQADHICWIKSMYTEAINHDPAITFLTSGSQQSGRPSMGAWLSYGLGSDNRNLPTFVALTSNSGTGGQPLYDRLWGSGFLPTRHQGVRFGAVGDPVLYLSNPQGVSRSLRQQTVDDINQLNRIKSGEFSDPEIKARIEQYELAFRMQAAVPELTDVGGETEQTFRMYGPESRKRGTYAANCLLARRLCERGVRFVQLFHRGWDQHQKLPNFIRRQCRATDQPTAALLADLRQRGMLDDTLVVWGGEFGRTVYCQGKLTTTDYGRDHHPRCFTMWMAGAGARGGYSHGRTDDFSYNVVENPVHIHDLNATILHLLGIDHKRLTFKYQGRNHRLTDVHGNVVRSIVA